MTFSAEQAKVLVKRYRELNGRPALASNDGEELLGAGDRMLGVGIEVNRKLR